jgi:hypothetical protein
MPKQKSENLAPVNKMISNYPLPISSRRAKYEAERARYHGWDLPPGHPASSAGKSASSGKAQAMVKPQAVVKPQAALPCGAAIST